LVRAQTIGSFVCQRESPLNVSVRTGKEARTTILLVDPDLGFVFWLGQAVDSAGYHAVPAKSVRNACELIQEHNLSVDILVIDPFLPNAFAFISHLRKSHTDLHVIAAIPEDWESLPPMTEVDATIRKPRHLTAVAILPWISLVQSLSLSRETGAMKPSKPLKN
jgi:CheY-like chemotaxis protein